MNLLSLEQIEKKTFECAKKIWPTVQFSVKFSPLINLSFGDVGSKFLLDISDSLKQNPDVLGEKLLTELNTDEIQGEFFLERGFVNYRGPHSHDWLFRSESEAQIERSRITVVLPSRPENVTPQGYLRLACQAYMQIRVAIMLGHPTFTNVGDELTQISEINFDKIFKAVLQKLDHPIKELQFSDVENFLLPKSSDVLSLWMTPDFIPRKTMRQFIVSPQRADGKLHLHIPSTRWCYGADANGWQNITSHFSEEKLDVLPLLFYAASDVNAEGIDWVTPLVNESANIWWWKSFLSSRIDTHFDFAKSKTNTSSNINELERNLLMRVKFLKTFQESAALLGKVGDYIIVVKDLLSLFNRYFNDPAWRLALGEKRLSQEESQIISGVYEAMKII